MLLRQEFAEAVRARLTDPAERAAAPDLLNAEVLQTLRRLERAGEIDTERSAEIIDDMRSMPLARYPTALLIGRAWGLRANFSAYDAMYVALAEELGTGMVTADARLATAVRAHTQVEVMLLA